MYPTLPFAGALLAVIFYELIYKKTQRILQNVNEDEGSDDLNDSNNSGGGEHDWDPDQIRKKLIHYHAI